MMLGHLASVCQLTQVFERLPAEYFCSVCREFDKSKGIMRRAVCVWKYSYARARALTVWPHEYKRWMKLVKICRRDSRTNSEWAPSIRTRQMAQPVPLELFHLVDGATDCELWITGFTLFYYFVYIVTRNLKLAALEKECLQILIGPKFVYIGESQVEIETKWRERERKKEIICLFVSLDDDVVCQIL